MAELRYLKDADGNIIYPVTHTDAIIGNINNNDNNDNNKYQTASDANLSTENKTIVGAINEIYQNVDNGKQLIASAIGNPLITNKSTFATMSEAILNLKSNSDNEILSLNSQIVILQNQIDILTEELENANRPPVYDVTQDGEVIYFVNSSTVYSKTEGTDIAVSVVLTEGIYRVSFDIKSLDAGWWSYGKIYIYDSTGEQIDYIGESSSKTTYQTYTNDITITGTCTVKIVYGGEYNTAHEMGTKGYMTNIKIFTHKC